MRIPRRGEVGWSGEQIEELEKAGYVMSGNRNKKMNAIRERKEGQVTTMEEKHALALFEYEARQKKEAETIQKLKQMLKDKLGRDAAEEEDGGEGAAGGV